MYIKEDETQITLSCIANMVMYKHYHVLKYFVDNHNQLIRNNLWFIAKRVGNNELLLKIEEENWDVATNN